MSKLNTKGVIKWTKEYMEEREKEYHSQMRRNLNIWLYMSGYSEEEIFEILKDENLLETYEKIEEDAENEKQRIINYTLNTYLRARAEERTLWLKRHS